MQKLKFVHLGADDSFTVLPVKFIVSTTQFAVAGIVLFGTSISIAKADACLDLFQRPVWLPELSVGVKESYDNNIFESGVSIPPAYSVPTGSVAALKDVSSWITAVSPRVDINLAPLKGDLKFFRALDVAYVPDFVIYHDQDSESYNAQRFSTVLKAVSDPVSISADNVFTYVDGSDFGPVYPGGLLSAYATVADRERREQIIDRANVAIQFNHENWFIRPTGTLLYYDMLTAKLNVPGYQNYADRDDVNGGGDVGYKITSSLAATIGYRYGHQQQEQYSFSLDSSPSDYQRVLLGLEGKPWHWLDVKILGGPDFRNYAGNSLTHITPVSDTHMITYYGEALLVATFTPKDTLTFKYKQWQWLSSTGKVPYFDSTYDLSYHRKLTSKLGFDLGGRILYWDYTSGNLSTCQRQDLQYTASATLGYAFNTRLNVSATYAYDWGRNDEDGIVNPQNREFGHQVISLAAQWKF